MSYVQPWREREQEEEEEEEEKKEEDMTDLFEEVGCGGSRR